MRASALRDQGREAQAAVQVPPAPQLAQPAEEPRVPVAGTAGAVVLELLVRAVNLASERMPRKGEAGTVLTRSV